MAVSQKIQQDDDFDDEADVPSIEDEYKNNIRPSSSIKTNNS